jgi:hypothetical protein
MEGITNLGKQVDAFEEAGEVHDDTDKVHVRVQQRNGRGQPARGHSNVGSGA